MKAPATPTQLCTVPAAEAVLKEESAGENEPRLNPKSNARAIQTNPTNSFHRRLADGVSSPIVSPCGRQRSENAGPCKSFWLNQL